MRIDVYLSNGKYIVVPLKGEVVLDRIMHSKDLFVEMRDKDGINHFVNADHIVEIKEIDFLDGRERR